MVVWIALIAVVWVALIALVVALCRAAAAGDAVEVVDPIGRHRRFTRAGARMLRRRPRAGRPTV